MPFFLSVKPTYSVHYYRDTDQRRIYNGNGEKHNAPRGVMTARAGKKIRLAVQWLLLCSTVKTVYSDKTKKSYKYRLAFITLTLSEKQKHDDNYIKDHMLRPFLKWLERQDCKLYVWKAESQKNGNIHFHITVDGFVHWLSVRKKWNNIQHKNGYKRAFEGIDGANSTDIHAVRNTKKIGSYIEKYLAKNQEDRRLINGRLWGCSVELSRMKATYQSGPILFDHICGYILHRSEEKMADYCTLWLHKKKVWDIEPLQEKVKSVSRLAVKQKRFEM